MNYLNPRVIIPNTYKQFNSNIYKILTSNTYKIPFQGWKIHISAFFDNYLDILNITAKYCIEHNISFKWIYKFSDFEFNLSKIEDRRTSGKFITIYPQNEEHFKNIIEELYELLKNYKACDIVTDRKYKNSIIQYRYGGNKEKYILSPNNEKINDREYPYYYEPNFVTDPFIENKTNLNVDLILNNRYEIIDVIHHSNAGCVYIANDNKNKNKVIIKETRKYLGLNEKITYISLRKNEKNILKQNISSYFPKYIDDFDSEELSCYYLVTELFDGKNLREYTSNINLIFIKSSDKINVREFENVLLELYHNSLNMIKEINAKGYYLLDVSEENIIITDDKIKFIDLETLISKSDLKDNIYKIVDEDIFSIDKSFIYNVDEIKLLYTFFRLITNYSYLGGNYNTKLNIIYNLISEYKFSENFINTFFTPFKEYNPKLYSLIFNNKNSINTLKYEIFYEQSINTTKVAFDNINKYINDFFQRIFLNKFDSNEIYDMYNVLINNTNIDDINYNYVKFCLIILKCYKILKLEKIPDIFFTALNKLLSYVTEINNTLTFEYKNDNYSPNFEHGNAGIIVINEEYRDITNNDLIDYKPFLNILFYNYTNKVSFDKGILGVIYALKKLNHRLKDKYISNNIKQKEKTLNIYMNDDLYKYKYKIINVNETSFSFNYSLNNGGI